MGSGVLELCHYGAGGARFGFARSFAKWQTRRPKLNNTNSKVTHLRDDGTHKAPNFVRYRGRRQFLVTESATAGTSYRFGPSKARHKVKNPRAPAATRTLEGS